MTDLAAVGKARLGPDVNVVGTARDELVLTSPARVKHRLLGSLIVGSGRGGWGECR